MSINFILRKSALLLQKNSKVGIVCCSNGQSLYCKKDIEALEKVLRNLELIPVFSEFIYVKKSIFSGTARQRAEVLMSFYKNDEIKAIFDISGGDIANEILPYLDFDIIAKSGKQFWGYSDLTTIINAIYAKTGKSSVLYQLKNLVYEDDENLPIRKSHENPVIKTLYEEFFGEPGSHKAHEVLHTSYQARGRFGNL